jgi:cytochrome c-type biogenesis protein
MSVAGFVTEGPLLLAAPVAAAAGLISFLSPCVLPLVPGYLSYVAGLSGRDLERSAEPVRAKQPVAASAGPVDVVPAATPAQPAGSDTSGADASGAGPSGTGSSDADPSGASPSRPGRSRPATAVRGRVVAGAALFVLGFTAVFVSYGVLFGSLGDGLRRHQRGVEQVLGLLTIVLGLAFAGIFSRLPIANREWRIHRLPARGLLGAPLLGVLFGVGWTPCIGPTLVAVQGLALNSATAARGAALSAAYCIGLGVPFLLVAVAVRRGLGALAAVRRHTRLVTMIGGVLLVVVGVLEFTGAWNDVIIWLRDTLPGFGESPL